MRAAAAAPGVPATVRAKLGALRAEFLHATGCQDWLASWWASLPLDDRRLLLALCGLDDDEPAARRPWSLMLQDHRDVIVMECKRVARLLDSLRWA